VLSERRKIVLKFIKSLPWLAEFLIVVVGAFGLFIYTSLVAAFHQSGIVRLSDAEARSLLTHELIVFSVLCTFLYVRGWTAKRIGFEPGLYASLEGLVLGLCATFACDLLFIVVVSIAPRVQEVMPHFSSSAMLPSIIAVSMFNPLFEETFVSGYVISALKDRHGIWTAVNVSTGIRLLYHLYQGVAGVLANVPVGLIFAFWYARRGNLWPLVVAHAGMDLYALTYAYIMAH
jgi:uncharacterized protein